MHSLVAADRVVIWPRAAYDIIREHRSAARGARRRPAMGVGIDLARVARIEAAMARHAGFAARVFTPGEIAYCERFKAPGPHFAARFAAKEAVLKALGTGLSHGIGWKDVEIVSLANRRPVVRLHRVAAEIARAQGIAEIEISLTHDGEYSAAVAVTRRQPGPLAAEAEAELRSRHEESTL
jgi:holo-[acyl-carrier protein] synthase